MLTTAKCRLFKGSTGYFKQLEKGMSVYKYDKAAIEDKKDDTGKTAYKTGKVKKFGNMEMVYIEGGTFAMGTPESEEKRESDEKQHKITVSSFWMGKYEVTQKQYKKVMGSNPSYFTGTGQDLSNLPVENVTWYDAVEFCNKLSEKNGLEPYYKIDKNKEDPDNKNSVFKDQFKYTVAILGGNGFRLPTEAEWEYACRAGTTTAYYWGDEIDDNYLWCYSNSGKETHPVGEKKANRFGLYDMSGNAWEWCFDWYGEYGSVINDPKGADSGMYRVLRGGSWNTFYYLLLRSADRDWSNPGFRNYNYCGFRVVRSAN